MIQDCEDGKIDVIYTKSISRFSRNMLDCVTVVRRLKELGIPVIFEKECINTVDRQSELFFHILAIIAEEESKSIGRNLKLGLLGLHDEGIPTGRVTYGYRRVNKAGEWRIEESEARRVRYAFDQAAKGVCYKDIRAGLDRMEKAENTGVSWTQNRNRLTKLLKHIAYQGDYMTDCYYTTYGKNGKRYSKLNKGERPKSIWKITTSPSSAENSSSVSKRLCGWDCWIPVAADSRKKRERFWMTLNGNKER